MLATAIIALNSLGTSTYMLKSRQNIQSKRLLLTSIMLSLTVTSNIWHKASKGTIHGK